MHRLPMSIGSFLLRSNPYSKLILPSVTTSSALPIPFVPRGIIVLELVLCFLLLPGDGFAGVH